MKYKKQKLIISVLIFLVGLWLNLFLSTNLHFLLLRKNQVISLLSIKEAIDSMMISKSHLLLFLCFQGFVVLGAIFYYVENHKPYQSEILKLTPQISTPVVAGQKQFGAATWLSEKEKNLVFKSFSLTKNNIEIEKWEQRNNEELEKIIEREEKGEERREDENLKLTIEKLFLSVQTYKCLNNAGIKTVEDIVNKSESELLKIRNFGKRSLEESVSRLKVLGLELKNPDKNNEHYNEIKNDEKTKLLDSGGIVIGYKKSKKEEKIFYIDDDTHTLCIGATSSGKTRNVLLQSIGTIGLAGESMILSDPKGELYTYTYPFLKNIGYEVICMDFKNPLKSNRYNFLQPIIDAIDEDNISKAVEATWDLTSALVPENSHNEKIWTNGEASIIASAIMAVVFDNKNGKNRRFQNMSNVYFFISEMCKDNKGKMPLLEYVKTLESNHPAKALIAISEVAPSKTRGSFYTSALTTLRLFTNPLIHLMTEKSEFDLKTIGDKKQAIFIILPDEKSTYYSLASLFVNQVYMDLVKTADQRGGRLKRRVNFMLEEFGNFVKIPDFANKLTVGGGRGIRFNLFLQSFMQLDEKYGKDSAGTIKSNCETWIYLQTDDLSTLEEMSKKLGNYTVSTYSLSSSHAKHSSPSSSHSINLTHRALLTVDEIRLLCRPYNLIISRNNPAIMFSPDLSQWIFNILFGLGDKEHNRKVREDREKIRVKKHSKDEIETWDIWQYYHI